jgi:PAS domain S-box-containing protein
MKPLPRALVPKATTIGLTLIVVLIVVNLGISHWNIEWLIEHENRVVHTQRVLTTLEEVLSRVTEAETSERGFLITGDETYLRPYEQAMSRAHEALDRLSSLTLANPQERAKVAALSERVQARFDELRKAIAAHFDGGFDAAKHSVSTNQGRRLMNEMRGLVAEMQEQEEAALAVRSEQSRRSGRITLFTNLIGALLGAGMVVLAFFLFRRDLALRQRADDANRRLAAIVETSDDSIVGKSLDGRITSWNAGARRVFGYEVNEVLGRPITMLCPPERVDDVELHLAQVRQGLHIEHFETTRLRKDGSRIEVSLTLSPIIDADGNVIGASAIGRDITEHKDLQREVLEIAAREQRRIGQDLHDGTGQELTGLAMMTQRLAAELSARLLPEATTAARIVDGLEQALDNVRALSKGLVPVEVDAEGLMVALADLAARTSERNAVNCTFQCDEPVCIVDNQTATHLYRLSQEAVTNSVKHGRPRNILVRLSADPELVRLEIRDDGSGFAPAPAETTGTGLRIMHYRADLIGAKLKIHAVQPHGTSVTCTLSQRQAGRISPSDEELTVASLAARG